MLPVLPHPKPDDRYQAFLDALRGAGFAGECEAGFGHRLAQSTDNSIYQILPDAVVYPRTTQDLQLVARVAARQEFSDIVLRPRGGGTGTNGQSLGDGVIVDVSRHLNRILSIDPVRRVAVVEAGVVKDQLQAALAPHSLFFPPELSTSNRATIGGMISTDASGQGSVLYGKTRHHVRAVTMVLPNGELFMSDGAHREASAKRAEIITELDTLEASSRASWQARMPQLNRNVTGYDLGHLRRDDGSIDPCSVICGSEGTLGFIATAELALTPIPSHTAMITVVYADFVEMLRHAAGFTAFGAASIEVIDGRLLELARTDISSQAALAFFGREPDRAAAGGACMVEFVGDNAGEIEQGMAALEAHLAASRHHLASARVMAHEDILAVWTMRKRAVGLLANVSSGAAPVAFVEDTAVPPEALADYIAEFRLLLESHGLTFGMFGHADAGVIHVRPDLNLALPEHRAKVRQITDAVFALTQKYGGVLWGEHGKGVRGAYTEKFFGELYPAVQRVKQIFDPQERFNPGKIASNRGALPQVDDPPMRGAREAGIIGRAGTSYSRAFNCNGNGACFDFDLDAPMCPSWKATRDRRQSPKGRATLMREWLRQLDQSGVDISRPGSALWGAFPRRLAASLMGRQDFSHEVKAVFDTCLGCKACSGTCPVKVNVPGFKARFLELYHSRYLRSLSDRIIADIELLLPLLRTFSPLYRRVMRARAGKWLSHRLGLTALPHIPDAGGLKGLRFVSAGRLAKLPSEARQKSIALIIDPFVSTFEPHLVHDVVELARRLGFRCWLVRVQNGKPLHAKGMLRRFAATAARTSAKLDALVALDMPLVGMDPAMTLVFRDEYREVLGRGINVQFLEEWLEEQSHLLKPATNDGGAKRLANHCSAQTNIPGSSMRWQRIFERIGSPLLIEQTGCCGMAGTFGHEVANRSISRQIYGLSWKAKVEGAAAAELLATGFSCRCQAFEESGTALRHPVSALLDLVGRDQSAKK